MFTLEDYNLLPDDMKRRQKCIQCGVYFKEYENIGLYLCRVHPGVVVVNNQTGCHSYSCCGYDINSRFYRDIAHGCRAIDHMSFKLSPCDQDKRLKELASFSTKVIPLLLMKYITAPLQESYLFRLPSNFSLSTRVGSEDRVFVHEAKLLNNYYTTYDQRMATESLYVTYRCLIEQDTALSFVENEADSWFATETREKSEQVERQKGSYNIKFNLDAILRELYHASKDSPLYTRVLNSEDNRQLAMESELNSVWKNTAVKRKNTGVNDVQDLDGEEMDDTPMNLDKQSQIIPFVILSRIRLK
jgi:hypothetical protein